jgi:hypothetical protein
MRTQQSLTIGALGLLMINLPANGWGPDGHHMVARLGVAALPPDMPAFLSKETERLMFLNYEPDAWRDPEEEALSRALRRGHDPDHHFWLELFAAPSLPADRYSFLAVVQREGKDPAAVGILPYRAMELFQRLRVSFRQWRSTGDKSIAAFLEARILDDAGILGHYIADAAEPLHVTVNHNGWDLPENPSKYTRDNTLHLRFEHEFVRAHIRDKDVAPLMRKVQSVDNGLEYIHAEIQRSHDQVVRLYELEKETRFDATDNNPKAVPFAAERLADAASTLRDLWYAAYRSSEKGR